MSRSVFLSVNWSRYWPSVRVKARWSFVNWSSTTLSRSLAADNSFWASRSFYRHSQSRQMKMVRDDEDTTYFRRVIKFISQGQPRLNLRSQLCSDILRLRFLSAIRRSIMSRAEEERKRTSRTRVAKAKSLSLSMAELLAFSLETFTSSAAVSTKSRFVRSSSNAIEDRSLLWLSPNRRDSDCNPFKASCNFCRSVSLTKSRSLAWVRSCVNWDMFYPRVGEGQQAVGENRGGNLPSLSHLTMIAI